MTNNSSFVYNFGAGPACLPTSVIEKIKSDLPNWHDGMSIMELSHRLPVTMQLFESIENNLRQLLMVPPEFSILFMHGGARMQFSGIPLNLLSEGRTADYIISGHWSNQAYDEAKRYGNIHKAADNESSRYQQLPSHYQFSDNPAFIHYTDNETIQGLEFSEPPKAPGLLVSDMTSNILTKEIDWSLYGLIYASAQKNLGIAGITLVILHNTLLNHSHPLTPSILNYNYYVKSKSLYNTPPVFAWYVLGLLLEWSKAQGGCKALRHHAALKSEQLYYYIDNSDFYNNPIEKNSRSRINIPFYLKNSNLEKQFIHEANLAGLKQLAGHKIVGGCRASLYNAMPMEGVEKLIEFMKNFAHKHRLEG